MFAKEGTNGAGNHQADSSNAPQPNPKGNQINLTIQRIYIKDLSFESPESPKIFANVDWKPEVNIELSVKNQNLENHLYEVVLLITVTLVHEKKTVLLSEVQQAGIFTIEGIDGENLNHLLSSYCPNILFPYAREAISDVVVRGGFPQLLLAPINFDALYEESKKKAASSN